MCIWSCAWWCTWYANHGRKTQSDPTSRHQPSSCRVYAQRPSACSQDGWVMWPITWPHFRTLSTKASKTLSDHEGLWRRVRLLFEVLNCDAEWFAPFWQDWDQKVKCTLKFNLKNITSRFRAWSRIWSQMIPHIDDGTIRIKLLKTKPWSYQHRARFVAHKYIKHFAY